MNKTIIININGIVFHIEEEAYDVLRSYMVDVKRHFGNTADSHEIVGDIENRIAEMFSERIVAGSKEVVTMADVEEVIAQMGRVDDFEQSAADAGDTAYGDGTFSNYGTTGRKLMRDPDDRVFGGVCSGLGHYLGMESKWVRLVMVLLAVFGGVGFPLYIVLWIVMPLALTRADRMAMRGEPVTLQNFKRSFEEEMEGLRTNFSGAGANVWKGVNSAGNAVKRIIVVIAKIIGVVIIIALCGGLVTLLVAVVASFGFLGSNSEMEMFPMNVIAPEYRTALLVSSLAAVIIPMLALIALIVRILFNKVMIGRYTGFTLLAIWLVVVGAVIVYGTRTARDFREQSTVMEEVKLESMPAFHLRQNDIGVIWLEGDKDDRLQAIRQRATNRNYTARGSHNRASIRVVRIDSLEIPYVTKEYTARGETYEAAAQRAGNIHYTIRQDSTILVFDSHFTLDDGELMRDQDVRVVLHVPIGTALTIDRELERHIRDLPFRQCADNQSSDVSGRADRTEWIMRNTGLMCRYGPAPAGADTSAVSAPEVNPAAAAAPDNTAATSR